MPLTVGLSPKHKAITVSPTDYLLSTLEGMIVARHIGHDGTLIRLGRVDQIWNMPNLSHHVKTLFYEVKIL
jgi:hypothetical protein